VVWGAARWLRAAASSTKGSTPSGQRLRVVCMRRCVFPVRSDAFMRRLASVCASVLGRALVVFVCAFAVHARGAAEGPHLCTGAAGPERGAPARRGACTSHGSLHVCSSRAAHVHSLPARLARWHSAAARSTQRSIGRRGVRRKQHVAISCQLVVNAPPTSRIVSGRSPVHTRAADVCAHCELGAHPSAVVGGWRARCASS